MNDRQDWNPHIIATLLLDMGRLALNCRKSLQVEIKSDNTPVTQADQEIERAIAQRLVSDGQSYLLGEESQEAYDATTIPQMCEGPCWVVDPIDGTHPYIHGLAEWGISIGRMEHSVVTDGAIFLPDVGCMLLTDGPAIIYLQLSGKVQEWGIPTNLPHYRPSGRSSEIGTISLPQDITKYGSYHGAEGVQTNGSCVYSVVLFILERYKGAILRVKLWDVAACLALLARCNVAAYTHSGQPVNNRVSSQLYHLEGERQQLWRTREHIYLSWDHTVNRQMRAHTQLPQ